MNGLPTTNETGVVISYIEIEPACYAIALDSVAIVITSWLCDPVRDTNPSTIGSVSIQIGRSWSVPNFTPWNVCPSWCLCCTGINLRPGTCSRANGQLAEAGRCQRHNVLKYSLRKHTSFQCNIAHAARCIEVCFI